MTLTIRKLLLPAALLAVAMALVAAAPASAGWKEVLIDCANNDPIQGDYKRHVLQEAKQHVTGDRLAYTECTAEISAAIAKLSKSKGGSGDGDGGAGGAPNADLNGDGVVTPAEKRKAKEKKERQEQSVASVNDTLKPDGDAGSGTLAGDTASDDSSLPLILAIVLAALLVAAGGAWYAAQRNPAIANALRRVPLPGRRG
jgi:hypothetical protein